MIKPRKQTYTMDMYLNKMKDKDIRSDADVQRLAGQWKSSQINELIYTVLTEDYIPPIILGEEKNSQLWIIDGLQRSSTLMLFRYGNYKITSSIEDSIVIYKSKKRDKKGNVENADSKIDGILDRISKLKSSSIFTKLAYINNSNNNIDFIEAINEGKVILIKIPAKKFSKNMRSLIIYFCDL